MLGKDEWNRNDTGRESIARRTSWQPWRSAKTVQQVLIFTCVSETNRAVGVLGHAGLLCGGDSQGLTQFDSREKDTLQLTVSYRELSFKQNKCFPILLFPVHQKTGASQFPELHWIVARWGVNIIE